MNEKCYSVSNYACKFEMIKNHKAMNNATQRPEFKAKYHNYIKGKFTALAKEEYFDVPSSPDGKIFTKAAH